MKEKERKKQEKERKKAKSKPQSPPRDDSFAREDPSEAEASPQHRAEPR